MAGPFSARTVEAVEACTRTLGGWPDADQVMAQANAATLGGLRAFGDRLAVRRRFHDPAVHRVHRPGEAPAAAIFDAMELARLDAIGVRWLSGVAKNLMAHPGAENDGLRWLAFETLAGRPGPSSKAGIAAAMGAGLPPSLRERLAGLAADLEDHGRFAAAAAAWARDAAAHVTLPVASAAANPVTLQAREVRGRDIPDRGDPGGSSAPLRKRADSTNQPGETGAQGGNVERSGAAGATYRAYTTAHDRVVNAAELADRQELAQLRLKLETELSSVRSVVARLAKRLLRVLMARQVRAWRFDLDEGQLDGSRLATLVTNPARARPFKQERESTFPNTVVSLLIDHSGSMRGRPMLIAALTVEIFARVLERCGVKCEVLGFTTREWDGGEPAREWAAHGYPDHPGRLNALEHIVVKGADVPWRRARIALGLFLHDEMLKENIDGEAVQWAHGRLIARAEPRRILVVVSDGTPMDEATLAANGHEYLDRHLQAVVDGIEADSPVRLAAIGIGHDVSHVYRNATKIARIEQLGPALTHKLTTLLAQD